MSPTTIAVTFTLTLCAGFFEIARANTFLTSEHVAAKEHVKKENVRAVLLDEIEGALGSGAATGRLAELEAAVRPMFVALPKNEHGMLSHSTVRYALHRLFVERHGWFVNGLEPAGDSWNSSSPAEILKDRVPSYVQGLFEEKLGGAGFGLHELAVLAAALEHLVHDEAITRLRAAFNFHLHSTTTNVTEPEANAILETHMMAFILSLDLTIMTEEEIEAMRSDIDEVFPSWNATREFVHSIRRNLTTFASDDSGPRLFDFDSVARVAQEVSERYGQYQSTECHALKGALLSMEDRGTGRVRLSDFYRTSLDGSWQFQESVDYLREVGALDESDANNLRVIVPNYIGSAPNCVAESSFYSVCCFNECEDLLSHLEDAISAPDAYPARIVALVSNLPSPTTAAPRNLSATLLRRLDEIAVHHDGMVPLHGRLFAQWMHHAYPRECPYPHLSGSTSPMTPNAWMEAKAAESTATEEEIGVYLQNTLSQGVDKIGVASDLWQDDQELLWSPEEELICVQPPLVRTGSAMSMWSFGRSAVLFAVLSSFAGGLVRTVRSPHLANGAAGMDKCFV